MVDAGDSKSPAARCVGSSPTSGTTYPNDFMAVIRMVTLRHRRANALNCRKRA